MYLRGALLKNDTNFYFDEYDRKKAALDGQKDQDDDEDGDEPLTPSKMNIQRNPLGEQQMSPGVGEQEPLSPKGPRVTVEVPQPQLPEDEVTVEDGAGALLE